MNKKFVSLEFFSKHFNVPQNILSWGIMKEIKNNEVSFSPCLIIKDTQLCIDVMKGEIRSAMQLPPCLERSLYKAHFAKNGDVYSLINDGNKAPIIEFSEGNLITIYNNRWYDESLNDKLLF